MRLLSSHGTCLLHIIIIKIQHPYTTKKEIKKKKTPRHILIQPTPISMLWAPFSTTLTSKSQNIINHSPSNLPCLYHHANLSPPFFYPFLSHFSFSSKEKINY
uniref:Uncharacterized protein n=1 Tax=Opuntia streptacantha TaxID=393608 RepID=A0A7C9EC54_OPUST